jgi:histidinol-phosphate aminotransferase
MSTGRAPEPRPGVRDVEPYVSPQVPVAVRLNTNEVPVPLPEGFTRDLAEAVRSLPLNRYPDGQMRRLREDLAAWTGHPVEGTWAANGSNEVIIELLLAYGGPGRTAVVFEPTYLLHSRIATLTSTTVHGIELDAPFAITDAAIDEAAAADPHVVFVCSPNNPTGNAQPVETTRALAEAVGALVVVDEAYVEFGGETAMKLIEDHPNIVVTRTLSKAFALAGARIGYSLSAPGVLRDLQRVRLPYHMSALTQAAGIAALRHAPEALAILGGIREQRDRIVDALGTMAGVTAYPSDANFVLFLPPAGRDAGEVWRALLDRGVLIRDLTSVVPRALRVTAGTQDETTQFLDALTEVLA